MLIRIAVPRAAVRAALLHLSLLVMTVACATEPPPRATKLDPSNPQSAESPALSVGALGEPAPARTTEALPSSERNPEHSHAPEVPPATKPTSDDGAGKPRAILYTCPMHPEVISDKPGKCPKCGMTLVPKPPESKP